MSFKPNMIIILKDEKEMVQHAILERR